MKKHTILGAGGSIGNPLTKELLKNGKQVRLASRSGFSMDGTESVKADITVLKDTIEATKETEVVYLCAGLAYDHKIWAVQWPKIISNAIEACKTNKCKLIFFDNVYMYGLVKGRMTEETPYNPISRKGEIRANISLKLEEEFKKGDIDIIIARAADLYGPYATKSSVPYIMAIDNLMKGKKARWLANVTTKHSFTYTPDCARSLLLLSESPDSFNQIWHLPTSNPAPTGMQFIELIAETLGVQPEYSVLRKWMVRAGGIFNKTIREMNEMMYQYEYDYYFDSSKFEKNFGYKPRSYKDGIEETIDFLMK